MTTTPLTTLTSFELGLMEAARALDMREADGEAVHLRLRDHRRHWLVQTPHGQLSFGVDDADLKPDVDLHLPLSDRISWFSDIVHADDPTLGVADATTAVIGSSEAWTAIDLVPWHGDAPQPWAVRDIASAVLPLGRFMRTLASARVLPSGTDEQRYPFPPMWLTLGDTGVNLHVDWRDFLPSRATYSMAVDSMDGSGTTSLPHRRIDEFLRSAAAHTDHDDDPPLTVAIAEVHRAGSWHPAVSLRCDSWHFTAVAQDVLAERWASRVHEQLEDFRITDSDPTKWLVSVDQRPVHVRLYGGHPDVVRASAALNTGLSDTLELLREISTLNGASTGVRYWFEDGTVWAAVDLPCTRMNDLAVAVRQVAQAATAYGPLLGAWC